MADSQEEHSREDKDQDNGTGLKYKETQASDFIGDNTRKPSNFVETDNEYHDNYAQNDNPFSSNSNYRFKERPNQDNLDQSDDEDDSYVCSKTKYYALLRNNELLHNIMQRIQAGELIDAPVNKKVIPDLPKNNINTDNNQAETERPEQCSDNLNKKGPSVRPNTQSPDGDKVKTYAEVCKPNVNIQSAFKTNQANNNSNTYTVPSMPSITSNQYPFAGQHQYPFMMPNYFANTSIPQVGQQNAVPQYIINQSRVSNPPELPTFKSKTLNHFKSYLAYFENYCTEHYGPVRERWNSVLISKMSKEIRSTLPPEAEFEWGFNKVVSHIQDYINLVGDKEESNKVSKFLELKKEATDSVTVFSVKLLQAFKAAYPMEELTYGHNSTLRERYIHALADDTKAHVISSTAAFKALGQSIPYESYVYIAEQYEKEIKPRQQNLNKNTNTQPVNKFYQNQYKQPNVNYNKVANEMSPNSNIDSTQQQQWVQDFESINLAVPPPNYNQNLPVMSQINPVNYPMQYNQLMPTMYPGTLPSQQAYVQLESRPKDVPPEKNTPPGVCSYCEKKNHTRDTCRLLAIRLREPYAVWCNKCYMRNHREIHCTYQVKSNLNQSYIKFNNNPNNAFKFQFHNKSNVTATDFGKGRTFSNSKFHTSVYKLNKELYSRLSKLPSELRSKVLDTYHLKDPKNNFIICPHYEDQFKKDCYYCKNTHPEVLRLEKVIASYDNKLCRVKEVKISKNIGKVNNIVKQEHIPVVKQSENTNKVKNKKVNNKNKNNKKGKVQRKTGKQSGVLKSHSYEQFCHNQQNIKNMKLETEKIKDSPLLKPLPDQALTVDDQLHSLFSPDWTQRLDRQNVKMISAMSNGQLQFTTVHGNNPFKPGTINLVQTLHNPEPRTFGIMNKSRRIRVTNESFNTPTTVKNVTPNQFWVNANNKFIYSLVDTGSEYSSVREDVVQQLNLKINPLNCNQANYTIGLGGKIPILGTVELNIKLLDVNLQNHIFKVTPNISEETDQLVLGHDFLVAKSLIYCGDRRMLRGYYTKNIIWSYQSQENSVTRILSNINCYTENKLRVEPNSVLDTNLNVDLPEYMINMKEKCDIDNFSYGIELNLVRPLNTHDKSYPDPNKYNIRYYTAYPDNFYVLDPSSPKIKLENQTNKLLNYDNNALVGKAYNIRVIYINLPVDNPDIKNKYCLLVKEGTYKPPKRLSNLMTKVSKNSSNTEPMTNDNDLISDNIMNITESLSSNDNETSDILESEINNFNNPLVITMINSDDHLLNDGSVVDEFLQTNNINVNNLATQEQCDNINDYCCDVKITTNNDSTQDDPLLTEFNPPDEFNLKEPEEWTKDSLKDSVTIGTCSDDIKNQFLDLLWEFKDTVSNSTAVGPSNLPEVHLIPKSNEIVYTPQYKFGSATALEIETIVEQLFKDNIVERSNSLFNNPIHLVRKKDGTGRICIDMRKTNMILERPSLSPLPSVEDVMSELHGMKVFSGLDLLSGFFQINLAPESRKYTAFTSVHRYQYVRLPFGCSASPIEFTRLLNVNLRDMLVPIKLSGDDKPRIHCKIYVDDLFLFSKTYADHLELLRMLFKLLKENNLKLKLEKCDFITDSITFLGFKFNQNYVEKENKYINKILDLPKPETIKDIMRFLGSCVYIHRFIEQFATVARPLTSITTTCKKKMRGKVEWTSEMEDAYDKLKEHVAKEVRLTYPDFSDSASPLIIACDASTTGTGGVLLQQQNGVEHIIAFTSSTFTATQRRYSVTELEILAVKASIRAFHSFIQNRHFILKSDHAPLLHLVSLRPFNSRIARTLEFLSNYNFEVQWVPGVHNTIPDMLSRAFTWQQTEDQMCLDQYEFNYERHPPGTIVDKLSPAGGDSLLFSLEQGLINFSQNPWEVRYNDILTLRQKLFKEIDPHKDKYKFKITDNGQAWKAHLNPQHPLPLMFIQAFANVEKVDVEMYFGLDTPIIFKAEKDNPLNRKIMIQSIANHHFNLLKYKEPINDAKIAYANYLKYKNITTIEDFITIEDLLCKEESTAYDALFDDQLDSLTLLNMTHNDYQNGTFDKHTNRQMTTENIKQNLKPNDISYTNINNIEISNKSEILDCNKAYEQERNGEFHEVHPESYANWYSRCCNHEYSTECFIPVVCGNLRFCANLDSGSSCSVLNMSVANKLFDQGKLTKIFDTEIKLICAGGLTKVINARIVSADISIGTARLSGVKFILLPDDMMFSCAIIGNEILSLKGIELDFDAKVVTYDESVIVELARLKHPRFYSHAHLPPVENNAVLPVTPEPYIKLHESYKSNNMNEIFSKLSKVANVESNEPLFTLDHFINVTELEELQRTNKELRNLKKIMQIPNYKLPFYLSQYNHVKNNLIIIDNVIYFKKDPYPPVPVLPTNCVITMALRIHDKYSHCGRDKLVDWVKTIAYHVKLSELVGKLCSSCPICLLKKAHPLKHTPPTIKIQSHYPYELVMGDLLSMPQQGRYKYILTVVDHFSKYAAAWPLKDKSSQSVADAFEQHILPTFLITPSSFMSDNGREFTSKIFTDMLKKHNIKQLHSASYHCESHGAIERLNRTTAQLLRVHSADTLDWPTILQETISHYNQSRHETLKTSPAEFLLNKEHKTHKKPTLTKQDIQYWRVGNPSFKSYQVGTFVMKVIPKVGNRDSYKLQNLYNGPYRILHIHNGGTSYSIRSVDDRGIIANVHHSQLRLWIPPDKILMKNTDFFAYYNYYRPLTPLESDRYSDECEPLEEREFIRNWRPSDEPCEIPADELSEDFDESDKIRDSDQENDRESGDEDNGEKSEVFYPMYQCPLPVSSPLPPPIQIPKNLGLGERIIPQQTNPSQYFTSSPFVNLNQPQGCIPSTCPNLINGFNMPNNVTNDKFIMPDVTKPPPIIPPQVDKVFSPIIPIPHTFTPTPIAPPYPPLTHTPELSQTPPYQPKQIFTPRWSSSNIPFPQQTSPKYHSPNDELNNSPKKHHPSPNTYFNSPKNISPIKNKNISNRESYTPPFGDKFYKNLLNENANSHDEISFSHLKQPIFPSSLDRKIQPMNEGLSPAQTIRPEEGVLTIGDNQFMTQPPSPNDIMDNENKPKYKIPSPSIMRTRSQTRREIENK
ncbi:unnamed protein product [Rotaria magnacalcarata]|uniref:RNA-directed DNA polymerase n=1 Tax=Rotaria magnacalcarata TaxID=392030 RepID=A0A816QZB2_9BILA|nr:unnamed protein product [Rotaria magnacalcarata]CAF4040667.1 unnamed protein product [Rotaria magnacalcarata]